MNVFLLVRMLFLNVHVIFVDENASNPRSNHASAIENHEEASIARFVCLYM